MGDAAAEDEDACNWYPRAAPIAALTTSRPATTILGTGWAVVRAGWLEVMPPD
jgi:hypothetical protein